MTTPMEVEFKYRADEIPLTTFSAFCEDRKPKELIVASGHDHFYAHADDADSFYRYRTGPDMNQLTFKRKTQDKNNFVRTEHNIDVKMTKEEVTSYVLEHGYTYNTSIFKTCFVYKYDWYILVYYICYDMDMKETGRFIEIEMSEDKSWADGEAFSELTVMEKLCKPLGLTPQSRVKKSLFEMFKKEGKK